MLSHALSHVAPFPLVPSRPVMSQMPVAAAAMPAAARYGDLPDRTHDASSGPMSRSQATLLKSLATEAYQPKQFERGLTREEAARRIEALRQEIALADSF